MDRDKLIPIRDIEEEGDLAKLMKESGGFTAKNMGEAVDILEEMLKDKECVKFLSFPSCIVSTGTRGIIKNMIKNRMIDVIITACGTLDHDLARTWKHYYHGDFLADDKELLKNNIHRLGNIFVPIESYGLILEEKIQPMLSSIYKEKKELSTKELIFEIGKKLENEEKKEESIVYQAYKNNVPIIIPGITDGAFGTQLWMFWQEHKDFKLNLFEDEQYLSDIIFDSKRTGALMIGGGISKHHTIWWNQFKDGLEYAVFITTAQEFDGSLSGARLREAISWGKVNKNAKFTDVICDATIALPMIYSILIKRIK